MTDEEALEHPGQLGLSEWHNLMLLRVLQGLVVPDGLDTPSEDEQRGIDVSSLLLSLSLRVEGLPYPL